VGTTAFDPARQGIVLNPTYIAGGVHLPSLSLWLDGQKRRLRPDRVFVSHAHSDHIARHEEVILTPTTSSFMRARLRGDRIEHRLSYGQTQAFADGPFPFNLTMLPAGHIPGSAMALVECEGGSLLYTGDFKLRTGLVAEPCEPRRADVLVIEATFGRPCYRFPPAETTWEAIIGFCQQTLKAGQTPVLLGYSLGKAQELAAGVVRAGLPVMLHRAAHQMSEIHTRCGSPFPLPTLFDADSVSGNVIVSPPFERSLLSALPAGSRTAVCTGWALDSGCRFRYGADAAFPLSDHADFAELLEMVDRVEPKKVLTLHGFAADLAQALRDRGIDAHAISEPDQLCLPLFAPHQ